MISRIRGELVSKDASRVEVATASGVVYELHVPLTIARRLPAVGADLELLAEYVVRDDVPSLYGFRDQRERALFRLLMTVQKIGPRLAMSMLSTYDARRLARALNQQDVPALVQVSGLGKKTAQRLILEIGDKVGDLAPDEAESADAGLAANAVAGLVRLGYGHAEAEEAVRDAMQDADLTSTEAVLRRALSRRG